jgi:hypothetical protein
MFDPLAHFECAGERAFRESQLAVGEVSLAPDLRCIGFTPGVAAVGVGGEVEGLARGLDSLGWIGPGEADARERDEQLYS